jgi:hypothetical protein
MRTFTTGRKRLLTIQVTGSNGCLWPFSEDPTVT